MKDLEAKIKPLRLFRGRSLASFYRFSLGCNHRDLESTGSACYHEFSRSLGEVAPPPPQPPASGEAASNPQLEPQSVVVPMVTPPSIVPSINNNAFKVDASKAIDRALSQLSDLPAQGAGLSAGSGSSTGIGLSGFGSSQGSGTAFTGIFYDLKQTRDKQPTNIDLPAYYAVLAKYLAQGWDNSVLDEYYKSKAPICTDSLAISTRPSESAPAAFGLENDIQPALWVIHYHAKVSAPAPGDYRLAGFADNLIVVRVRGQDVLDGGINYLSEKDDQHVSLPFMFPSFVPYGASAHLKVGPTFHMDVADPVDMDILIGDDGGLCSFFLLIQKMDGTYEKTDDGTLKLPFFQLSSKAAPAFSPNEEHPPYSTTPEPWQAAGN